MAESSSSAVPPTTPTLEEIVERELSREGWPQDVRPVALRIAKATVDACADTIKRVGRAEFEKYPPEQPGERSAVERCVYAIGNAVLGLNP